MTAPKTRSCIIIPARHGSNRFPGKPLVPLLGKPMILWVAERAAQAVGQAHVYVATEDERIASLVNQAGFATLMTSPDALTGTDRIAEAAVMLDYDIYVNVQGDEPLVGLDDIRKCISLKVEHPEMIINGFCRMGPDEDPDSVHIPKVVANEKGVMVYMSRKALPGYKECGEAPRDYMKQVCIYGFARQDLQDFAAFGRKSMLERWEDIEILRFLELNRSILMYECYPGSLAVDVPGDVPKVEAALLARAGV